MDTKDAYNEWAASYDKIENKTRDLEGIALKKILKSHSYESILELGCGTGKNTRWLSGKCNRLTAVDFSDEMLEVAKQKYNLPDVIFKNGDITQPWNFGNASLVTCSLVLEHICDVNHIFQQAYKTITPNGQLYICELHPYKQLQGSRAKFELNGKLLELEYFVHHISDYFLCAKENGFICLDLQEWFDSENRNHIPRLCSFLFKRNDTI